MASVKEVFIFYREYVKPLYCEIEARNNSLPVELLFEIHAAFDHLKRFFVEGEDCELSCKKAISHLKRGSLDAFKLKLKYYNADIERLQASKVDLELLDNGQFWPKLIADKCRIIELAKKARLSEGHTDPEQAFELWAEVSLKIDTFYESYLSRQESIEWAKKKTFSWLNKDTWRGIGIGIATGCLSSYLIWWATLPA